MSKLIKYGFIILSVICVVLLIGSFTGMFRIYTVPTSSNEPSVKQGRPFVVSNLKKPGRLDIVCFNTKNIKGKSEKNIYRLCGIGGDIIQIKDALLFINGREVDNNLRLKHYYAAGVDALSHIPENAQESELTRQIDNTTYLLCLEDEWVMQHPELKLKLFMSSGGNEEIKNIFNQSWTTDNFGPIRIPDNKMFLLGDNRHNAYDSRFKGFIDESEFVGTVILK
jgi:signal peptidase I